MSTRGPLALALTEKEAEFHRFARRQIEAGLNHECGFEAGSGATVERCAVPERRRKCGNAIRAEKRPASPETRTEVVLAGVVTVANAVRAAKSGSSGLCARQNIAPCACNRGHD